MVGGPARVGSVSKRGSQPWRHYAGWRGAPDQPRFGFAASSALRYGPGCVRLVLPALLDETAQHHVELVLGIPFDQVLQLWAAVCLQQVRLADDAFRLLVTLNV
jgi:hypothetical protein